MLVGAYAHMKPGDPETFVTAVAAVLQQYPLGLVRECVDPRIGVPRKIKFLSVAELAEWLDDRLEFHRTLAAYEPREEVPRLERVYSEEHKATMRERWANLMAIVVSGARKGDPIMNMRRAAKREAERRLENDKRRVLAELKVID